MEEMVRSPDPTHLPLDPRMLCIVRKTFNRSLMGSFQNNFSDLTLVYVHKTYQYFKTCKFFWSLCYIYTQTVSVLTRIKMTYKRFLGSQLLYLYVHRIGPMTLQRTLGRRQFWRSSLSIKIKNQVTKVINQVTVIIFNVFFKNLNANQKLII